MGDGQTHIIVTLDTKEPIEIGDFVTAFTSVASQYNKFMTDSHPEIGGDARVYVKEVRSGSIIADLIPVLTAFGVAGSTLVAIQQADAIVEFVKKYGGKLKVYLDGDGIDVAATNSDLKDFLGSVAAIANDPDGKASIEAAYFEDGKKDVRAAIRFTTPEARRATEHIEIHRRALRATEHALHERVLMRFVQSNIKRPAMEKRTGERVIIEEIAKADRPLIYASELAEQQIKHEMIEADENVYKKGFVVDIYIETKNDRPVAYKVTNLHQVIDLPDD
jgi:hypothetical protein